MIKSYGNKLTEDIANGLKPKKISLQLYKNAYRKLMQIKSAVELDDLKSPPGNRLKRLVGDKDSYHSIRVNRQWRIIFIWKSGNAYKVELIDYH